MRFVKSVKAAFAVLSSALILGGMCLLIWPETSAAAICTALGVTAMVYGVVRIAGYLSNDLYRLAFQFDLAAGILIFLIGLALLLRGDLARAGLPVLLGVFLLADSLLRLQTALDARHFGMRRWWTVLLAALLGATLGALLLLRPLTGGRILVRHLGLVLILDGAENLLVGLYTVRAPRPRDVIDTICTESDS